MPTIRKLNLGCGEFKKDGYVNVDFRSVSEPDIRHDLNEFPYPFGDDEFSLVEADHLLEHLTEPFAVMKELARITENGGVIQIRVPHFSRGFSHPQHHRGFDVSFPLYFDKGFKGGYQGVDLTLLEMELTWFAQPDLKKRHLSAFAFKTGRLLGRLIDFLANRSPYLCSKIWCFWVGGFDEIRFRFKVKKDERHAAQDRPSS